MVDANSPEQEIRPAPSLKEVFLQTTFAPGRAIADSIRAIELGIFADEGRELIRKTLEDPQHREFGKVVTIDSNTRKMRIYKTETGTENSVNSSIKLDYFDKMDPMLPRHQRIPEMKVTGMHSHPDVIPPSSEDLTRILLGDFDEKSETAVFVVTTSRIYLIFRGNKTPHFTFKDVTVKKNLWEKVIEERVKQFRTPQMSVDEQYILNERARTQLLRQISTKYDLKIFSGDLSKGTVQLQS